MELNSILFPSPSLQFSIEDFEDELIFIPKFEFNTKGEVQNLETTEKFIPCLLLLSKLKGNISKNFMIYFHGNAEDIFYAREIAEKIRLNLDVKQIT